MPATEEKFDVHRAMKGLYGTGGRPKHVGVHEPLVEATLLVADRLEALRQTLLDVAAGQSKKADKRKPT